MRKLAHIEEISVVSPIDGADKIEVATILGWKCVIKKGEFQQGDKVVYIEIDSLVPPKPEFEFLKDRKYRVRTIKLRGQISQGLVVPIPETYKGKMDNGTDMTKCLGIKKYLSPTEIKEIEQQQLKIINEKNKLKKFMMRYSWFRRIFLSRKQKQSFPYWVSKTDEERIQNIPHVIEQFKNHKVYVTEKIDFQSVTFTGKMMPKFSGILGRIMPKTYRYVICSRNLVNNNRNGLYWLISRKYNIHKILEKYPYLTIQGEQGNSKVQGNKYGISEPTMWVFNVINHEKGYHYNLHEMIDFCKKNGLEHVPIINNNDVLSNIATSVDEFIEYSKGKSLLNNNIYREGIVVRCIDKGKKLLSFKVINPDFLIKYD